MSVPASQEHRVISRDRVERCAGGLRILQDVAANFSENPATGRRLGGSGLDPRDHRVERRVFCDGWWALDHRVRRRRRWMRMRIVDTGNHEPSAGIHHSGREPGLLTDVGIRSDQDDTVIRDRECLGPRLRCDTGKDARVEDNQVGSPSL
ncbi:MAG: hypothetical protein H0W08_12600 [Acidobacteria bacterium]|nr:hypothetical protein [Acidobacteriota bacterium]